MNNEINYKSKKSVDFARVSSKKQAEHGYSLDAQKRLFDEYSKDKELKRIRQFIVPESAKKNQERKIFQEMMKYVVERNIEVIVVEKVDRLTRDFRSMIQIDDWLDGDGERQVHLIKDGLILHRRSRSQDKLNWGVKVLFAKNYIDNLREETIKGMEEKAEQGDYPGNHKRGYKVIGEAGHKKLVIDDSEGSEALFIKQAFELYDTGEYTTHTLGKHLFKEGWKSKSGKPIGKSEMHKLLIDCFYCGEFRWKDRHYPEANHPPLVSKELFYRVQGRINRKLTGKYRKHNFLLKDFMICGECGRSVVGEVQKGHHYYHCTRFETNCTQRKYMREEVLGTQIAKVLESFLIQDKDLLELVRRALKESHTDEMEYHTQAISELNRQEKLIQTRLDTIYDDKLDGVIDSATYERKSPEYRKQLEDVLVARRKHSDANVSYFELGSNIFELAQKAHEIYAKEALPEQKRSLLQTAFSNFTLKDEKLAPAYINGFQMVAERAKDGNWLRRSCLNFL